MATAKVYLKYVVQDSQDFGSDDDHMVSRVFFELEVGGKLHKGLYADIKQPVGSAYATAPLEVSKPVGYDGPFNHGAFRQEVEKYYRWLLGSMVGMGGGGVFRMRNNHLQAPVTFDMEVGSSGGAVVSGGLVG